MIRARGPLLVGLGAVLIGCQELPKIELGVCGNGVVEVPEDCDGIPPEGGVCRPPGSIGACHFDCSPAADGQRPACRPGSGCDAAGVCRKVTGRFALQPGSIVANADRLLAGDFDGDHRDDVLSQEPSGLLGVTKMRIHYFDERARLTHTWASPRVVTTPLVRDVTGDGRADLLFSDYRIGVMQGQADRSLVPVPYPSYFLPGSKFRVLPVLDIPIDDSAGLLILIEQDGQLGIHYRDRETGEVVLAHQLGEALADLSGEPAIGNVLEDDQRFPCRDVAFAIRGAKELSLYSPCEMDPKTGLVHWRADFEVRSIPLDPPGEIDGPVLIADLNGDGHLDVMVGAQGQTYAAFADGAEIEPARPYWFTETGGERLVSQSMPLAAGDFNRDGAADLVFPELIVASTRDPEVAGISYRLIRRKLGAPWTSAHVVDLNGDGRADVVAASNQGFDVDFLNGTGANELNPFLISTSGPVQYLAVGDLDGDLINDLAFVQAQSRDFAQASVQLQSRETEAALSVAFGAPAGPPTAPTVVTRLSGVDQISMIYASTGTIVANLLVLYDSPEPQGTQGSRLSLFESGSDRSFLSPIELTSFASDRTLRSGNSLAIATGAFVTPGETSIASLARKNDLLAPDPEIEDFGLWLLADIRSKTNAPFALDWPFGKRVLPVVDLGQGVRQSLRIAAGDLDSDGIDELVAVGPTPDLSSCTLLVTRFSVEDEPKLSIQSSWSLSHPCVQHSQLAVADVDRDQALDLVLLTTAEGESGKVLIFWNKGDGTFDETEATEVPSDEGPRAFDWAESASKDRGVLAFATERALHTVQFGPGRSFEVSEVPLELERGTGVAAADLDGDQIMDLVVADDGALRVLRAELEP